MISLGVDLERRGNDLTRNNLFRKKFKIMKYTIHQINQFDSDQFASVLGNIVEHCSVLAAAIWTQGPFRDLSHVHEEFCKVIDSLPPLVQEGILRSHPDLAGRLAEQGLLTSESTNEQRAAGLGSLSPEEKATLTRNNDAYKVKFGFPFVICARDNKKQAILEGVSARLNNHSAQELRTGIEEVKKIGFYRLEAILEDSP